MRAGIAFALLVLAAPAAMAEDCYVRGGAIPGYQDIEAMRSGPPPVLLIDDEALNDWEDVQLKLALDETGRMTCVAFEFGQVRLETEALALARQWRFKPYLKDGKPTAAWFSQRVDVRWRDPRPAVRVPFPAVRDWATLRIRAEMSSGYMGCIATDIEIAGDGVLIFEAEYRRWGRRDEWQNVRASDRLSPGVVRALVERFRRADFFWLHDSYTGDRHHVPTSHISIAFDGHKKRVQHEDGRAAGMPAEVAALQEEIERLADRDRRAENVGCN
jgi:hypothetical protein